MSSLKFSHIFGGLSSTILWQLNSDAEKFVPEGFQECSQMNTSRNSWALLCHFRNATTEMVMNSWTILSQEMRLESHYTPESKRQSQQWQPAHALTSPPQKKKTKIRADTCNCKNHVQCIWGQEGHSFIDFLPCGETINSDTYCITFKRLWRAVKNCWWGLLSRGVFASWKHSTMHCRKSDRFREIWLGKPWPSPTVLTWYLLT
jgi:hypothetical protein